MASFKGLCSGRQNQEHGPGANTIYPTASSRPSYPAYPWHPLREQDSQLGQAWFAEAAVAGELVPVACWAALAEPVSHVVPAAAGWEEEHSEEAQRLVGAQSAVAPR